MDIGLKDSPTISVRRTCGTRLPKERLPNVTTWLTLSHFSQACEYLTSVVDRAGMPTNWPDVASRCTASIFRRRSLISQPVMLPTEQHSNVETLEALSMPTTFTAYSMR